MLPHATKVFYTPAFACCPPICRSPVTPTLSRSRVSRLSPHLRSRALTTLSRASLARTSPTTLSKAQAAGIRTVVSDLGGDCSCKIWTGIEFCGKGVRCEDVMRGIRRCGGGLFAIAWVRLCHEQSAGTSSELEQARAELVVCPAA